VASLDAVVELIAGRFARSEPRQRVGTYLRGLLAGLERKNGWTLAEHAGAVSPDGMQRLLRTADWDVDGVRDDLRGYVLQHLSDDATGVFVVDETGFVLVQLPNPQPAQAVQQVGLGQRRAQLLSAPLRVAGAVGGAAERVHHQIDRGHADPSRRAGPARWRIVNGGRPLVQPAEPSSGCPNPARWP
jgi:hypothetical protein